jgi:hypothetical protein
MSMGFGMQMHDAAGLGQALVQPGVQVPGGRIGCIGPLQRRRVLRIEQEEVARADARKVASTRVDEKLRPRDRETQVIRDRFMHVEACEPAERGGEIDAFLVQWACGRERLGCGHDLP